MGVFMGVQIYGFGGLWLDLWEVRFKALEV